MVSIRCAGLLLWVFFAINAFTSSIAQLKIGFTEFATTESSDIPEYVNLYPILHPCHRFADISNNEFYSPASPPDAPTYPNNTNCTLVLTAPKNHVIDLDFLDWFEIEKSDGCKNDFLEVRDGKYGFNNVLLHFCGIHEFPPNVRSSNRHLWIYFKSDENIEGKGFRAVFHYVPRANKSNVPEIKECKKEISFKEEGRFSKDDIPTDIIEFDKQHDLPIDCMWVIIVRLNWREFKRSREQLDRDVEDDKRSSKTNSGPYRRPSIESTRFGPAESGTTPCYVPGEEILPILIKNTHPAPTNGNIYNQNIYTVDKEDIPKMCDSSCQTRESLFTSQEYSSGNSTPNSSIHTNSPPGPFSTFGYNRKDSNKFKAEAKIEMHREKSNSPSSKFDKRYSVQTTKSAPDVIVTH